MEEILTRIVTVREKEIVIVETVTTVTAKIATIDMDSPALVAINLTW